MIHKDRYSITIIIFFVTLIIFLVLIKMEYFKAAAFTALCGFLPLFFTLLSSGKIHLTKDQINNLDLEYKGEFDCNFSKKYTDKIDGIKINGIRYKVCNGSDVYIDDNNNFKPCGFGSAILLRFIHAGKEPKSIQNDPCWK